MNRLPLPAKVTTLHQVLHAVPHAFGGALALAYWAEPRATVDIDLNVFVSTDESDRVLTPLRQLDPAMDEPELQTAPELIERDGQVRLRWDGTPVDLFFAYDEFHHAAARAAVEVPFADTTIPVLSASHLTVCKVVFNRSKDWVDIEAMQALGTALDTAEILRWVGRIAGDDDPRYDRIAAMLTR